MFSASCTKIMDNRVENKKLEKKIKNTFLIQTLVCVIIFAEIISDDVI